MTYITKPKPRHPTLPKNALCHIRRTPQNFRRPGESRDRVTLFIGTASESSKEMSNLHAAIGLST